MKDKINVAELLKDCPKGMELDCTMYEDICFYKITDDPIFPIRIKRIDGCFIDLTKYGGYADCPSSKCVIFPKGKTTWEGFQRPFKDGDVVRYLDSIAIFKEWGDETLFRTHVTAYLHGDSTIDVTIPLFGKSIKREARFATEEEKQKLFQAIKDNGYKWNEETKTLEKLDEPKFKNGDVITCTNSACSFVAIFKESNTDITFRRYVSLTLDPVQQFWTNEGWCDFSNPRLATEEEKQKLFRAIKDNGYKWNPDNKTLEKVEPKFKVGDRIRHKHNKSLGTIALIDERFYHCAFSVIPICDQDDWELVPDPDKFDLNTLVPFESRVLIRNDKDQYWIPAFWGGKRTDGYTTTFGWSKYCIPFDGNKHLLNSNKECDKFYRTWEKTGN